MSRLWVLRLSPTETPVRGILNREGEESPPRRDQGCPALRFHISTQHDNNRIGGSTDDTYNTGTQTFVERGQ